MTVCSHVGLYFDGTECVVIAYKHGEDGRRSDSDQLPLRAGPRTGATGVQHRVPNLDKLTGKRRTAPDMRPTS